MATWRTCCFNPRARAGRDTQVADEVEGYGVSIHAPARGATFRDSTSNCNRRFQSTRPRGARPTARFLRASTTTSFNPRARAGRDVSLLICANSRLVSIHAPARGATRVPRVWIKSVCVSIHAPARGATVHRFDFLERAAVSIHAPARGATRTDGANRTDWAFQSTRPRGARPALHAAGAADYRFQSTRPRGARRGVQGHRAGM